MFESEEEEISERMYNSDEGHYIPKTKAETENSIYSKIRYECKECHEEFRNKIALTTHTYSHNREKQVKKVSKKHRRLRYKLQSEHERLLYYR